MVHRAVLAALLAAAALGGLGRAAPAAGGSSLEVTYTSPTTLRVTLGGTVLQSGATIPAGTYTVDVYDDPNTGDLHPEFSLSGPGVLVDSDLGASGMGIDSLSSFGPFTFQPSSTYAIEDRELGGELVGELGRLVRRRLGEHLARKLLGRDVCEEDARDARRRRRCLRPGDAHPRRQAGDGAPRRDLPRLRPRPLAEGGPRARPGGGEDDDPQRRRGRRQGEEDARPHGGPLVPRLDPARGEELLHGPVGAGRRPRAALRRRPRTRPTSRAARR